MDQPIDITVRLQVAPENAGAAEDLAGRIAAEAATIDGFTMTHNREADGGVLTLAYRGGQGAIDRHLAEHGSMYQAFEGLGSVVRVTIDGPADDATVAAFGRLSGPVERR